jgi:hypothetical protein
MMLLVVGVVALMNLFSLLRAERYALVLQLVGLTHTVEEVAELLFVDVT